MAALEQLIAGTDSFFVAPALASLLGLRHAVDPDDLVAIPELGVLSLLFGVPYAYGAIGAAQ